MENTTQTETQIEKKEWSTYIVDKRFVSHGAKGGRVNKTSCLVISGNGEKVGYAQESSKLFAQAIKKSSEKAQKTAITYQFANSVTIPMKMEQYYKGAKIIMWPLKNNMGYKCSSTMKQVAKHLNIHNLGGKIYTSGSRNTVVGIFRCLDKIETQMQRINFRNHLRAKRQNLLTNHDE